MVGGIIALGTMSSHRIALSSHRIALLTNAEKASKVIKTELLQTDIRALPPAKILLG